MLSNVPKRKPKEDRRGDARMPIKGQAGEIVLYSAPDGTVELNVRLERESIWLNLNQIAELFDRDKSVISRHLHNVFKEGELEQEATVAKNATAQREGNRISSMIELVHFLHQLILHVLGVNNCRGLLGNSNG